MGEEYGVPDPSLGKEKPAKKKRVLAEGDLMKANIRSGEPASGRPKEGDLIAFHYTVCTKVGSVVESTRSEHGGTGNPLKLVLGKSRMIIAWEEGLPTMQKNEIARFKVKAALHYGDPECPVPVPEHFPKTDELMFDIELLDFFPVKVVTDDLAILKQVVKDGVGWETPREPYEVSMRIVGQVGVNGAPFIVRKEEPLYFTFGKGQIPGGLEKGVETMTKGEKAVLYILDSSYITEATAIPELPMRAPELQFEVEVLQIIQVRDILGNGCVMKRRVKDGKGEFPIDCPLQDSTLRIHYKGMLPNENDKVFYNTRRDCDGGKYLEFESGEGMVPEGLEMCVRLMLPGEISIINSTAQYAYDKFARPPLVPERAPVKWEVELLSFDKRKDWTGLTFRQIMDDTEKQKATGNRLFKEGKFELARAKYEFILREFKHVNPNGDDEATKLGHAQTSLQLNVAACHQKLADYVKAVESCNKVLEGNPDHVKALYRRGMAFTATADFDEARNDFKQMITIDKSSETDANAALAKLKKKEQEVNSKVRKQFKGMFDKKPGLLSESPKVPLPEKQGREVKGKEKAGGSGSGSRSESESDDDAFASLKKMRECTPGIFRVGFDTIKRLARGRCSII